MLFGCSDACVHLTILKGQGRGPCGGAIPCFEWRDRAGRTGATFLGAIANSGRKDEPETSIYILARPASGVQIQFINIGRKKTCALRAQAGRGPHSQPGGRIARPVPPLMRGKTLLPARRPSGAATGRRIGAAKVAAESAQDGVPAWSKRERGGAARRARARLLND